MVVDLCLRWLYVVGPVKLGPDRLPDQMRQLVRPCGADELIFRQVWTRKLLLHPLVHPEFVIGRIQIADENVSSEDSRHGFEVVCWSWWRLWVSNRARWALPRHGSREQKTGDDQCQSHCFHFSPWYLRSHQHLVEVPNKAALIWHHNMPTKSQITGRKNPKRKTAMTGSKIHFI